MLLLVIVSYHQEYCFYFKFPSILQVPGCEWAAFRLGLAGKNMVLNMTCNHVFMDWPVQTRLKTLIVIMLTISNVNIKISHHQMSLSHMCDFQAP